VAFIRFLVVLGWAWVPWTIAVYAGAALLVPAGGRNRPDWDNLIGAARLGVVFAVPLLAIPSLYLDEPLGGSPGWWIASYGLVGVGAVVLMSADYLRGRGRSPEEARAAVAAAVPVAVCAAVLAAGIVLAEEVRWERFVPLAAVLGGGALLVSPRRELVTPAMLALGAVVLLGASGARLEGGVGDLRMTATDAREGRIVGRRAVGDVDVDLRQLRGRAVSVVASSGIGDVRVTLPERARVEFDVRVGRGRIDPWATDAEALQGFDRRLVYERAGSPGGGRIRLVAEVGLGNIEIEDAGL
jgi:hypothetical protein